MIAVSDIRPMRSDIDALLASASLTVEMRRAVIDALEDAALLSGSKLPILEADPTGRLVSGRVDRAALEKFDETTRTQVITVLSGVGDLA